MDSSALAVGEPKSYATLSNEEAKELPVGGDRTAVLVVHGMGQQRKFETLSSAVVDGIHAQTGVKAAVVRNVRAGDERSSRIELELNDGRRVDVYEAYWAPITEGQVTLRDVMTFLWDAAANGIKNARRNSFRRWVFDKHEAMAGGKKTFIQLTLAAGVLASLVLINALTLILGSAATINAGPDWAKSEIVLGDLTATILMFLFVVAGFVGVYVCSAQQKKGAPFSDELPLSNWGLQYFKTLAVMTVAVALTILATIGFARYPWLDGVARFMGTLVSLGSIALIGFAAMICVAGSRQRRLVGIISAVVLVAFAYADVLLAVGRASAEAKSIFAWMAIPPAVSPLTEAAAKVAGMWLAVWGVLAWVSAKVRGFLVQYVGDVAAYVGATTLDRFESIRERIKECTSTTANAVYRMADDKGFLYRNVAVVGHSLGSVAAYDCLNRMLNEDAHAGGALRVRERTTGFVTFGSPLDKTAFLFEVNTATKTAARAALAATIQPLITDRATTSIPWTNIFSRWDIISGDLNFYGDDRVNNLIDFDAVTPLGAHTEYWANTLVWRVVDGILPAKSAALATLTAPRIPVSQTIPIVPGATRITVS